MQPPGLTAQQGAVLSVKYQSAPIGKMEPVAVVKGIQKALMIIHVVTGWALLENDTLLQMFETLLFKKLTADFPTLNFNEIEYAFLHHTTGIRSWGASFNIPLMEEVLNAYISVRAQVSRLEDQHEPIKEIEAPKSLTLDEWEEWAADTERMYNNGILGTNLLPIPLYNYHVACENIMLDEATKKLYYRAARGFLSYLQEPEKTRGAIVLAKQIALSKYFDERKAGKLDPGTIPPAQSTGK